MPKKVGAISKAGCVTSLKLLRGIVPALDISAMVGVARWCYTPAVFEEAPVKIVMTVTVNFSLN